MKNLKALVEAGKPAKAKPKTTPKPKTARPAKTEHASKSYEEATKKAAYKPRSGADPAVVRTIRSDNVFGKAFGDAATASGNTGRVVVDDSEQLIIGLRLPALSLRYLFMNDVLPLGRVIELIGRTRSCKSALLFEMFRWTILHGGNCIFSETEDKDAPDLRNSILENRPEWFLRPPRGRIVHEECNSTQEWQASALRYIKMFERASTHEDKRGRKRTSWTEPLMLGVDSYAGAAPDSARKKIDEAGFAEMGFSGARQAADITAFLQALPNYIRNRPILVVGTNHLRQRIGQTMPGMQAEEYAPGGKALEHAQSLVLRMSRIKDIEKVKFGGSRVKIKLGKNSLGPANRSIEADLLWEYRKDDELGVVQQTYWDWYGATVDVLLSLKKEPSLWKEIVELIDIHPVEKGKKRVWSKALGVSEKDPVEYTVFGRLIEDRFDLVEELQKVLRIKKRIPFVPGEDMERQVMAGRRASTPVTDIYPLPDLSAFAYISDNLADLRRAEEKLRVAQASGRPLQPEDFPPEDDEDDDEDGPVGTHGDDDEEDEDLGLSTSGRNAYDDLGAFS